MKKTIVLLMLMTVISSVTLTACGGSPAETTPVTQPPAVQDVQTTPAVSEQVKSEPTVTVKYVDGTYKADGAYTSPAGAEKISVSLTVKGDVVTDVNVAGDSKNEGSRFYIKSFVDGVDALVVGKKLDELGTFSAVNGSSLTPKGFEAAVATIKAQAKK